MNLKFNKNIKLYILKSVTTGGFKYTSYYENKKYTFKKHRMLTFLVNKFRFLGDAYFHKIKVLSKLKVYT